MSIGQRSSGKEWTLQKPIVKQRARSRKEEILGILRPLGLPNVVTNAPGYFVGSPFKSRLRSTSRGRFVKLAKRLLGAQAYEVLILIQSLFHCRGQALSQRLDLIEHQTITRQPDRYAAR